MNCEHFFSSFGTACLLHSVSILPSTACLVHSFPLLLSFAELLMCAMGMGPHWHIFGSSRFQPTAPKGDEASWMSILDVSGSGILSLSLSLMCATVQCTCCSKQRFAYLSLEYHESTEGSAHHCFLVGCLTCNRDLHTLSCSFQHLMYATSYSKQ